MLTVISPAKKLNETTVDLPSTLPLSKPALQTSADEIWPSFIFKTNSLVDSEKISNMIILICEKCFWQP